MLYSITALSCAGSARGAGPRKLPTGTGGNRGVPNPEPSVLDGPELRDGPYQDGGNLEKLVSTEKGDFYIAKHPNSRMKTVMPSIKPNLEK